MMTGMLEYWGRSLSLTCLCLCLTVPTELHATSVEFGAHDVEGAVSVDARHAGHEAHFEHSAIEMQSHCAACVLTQITEALPFLPEVRQLPLTPTGALFARDNPNGDPGLDHHAPSRAPPLL